MNRKQYTIAGLIKLGYTEVHGRSRKYRCFDHPTVRLTVLVGRSGGVRRTRGPIARSVSITDTAAHSDLEYVGKYGPVNNPEACHRIIGMRRNHGVRYASQIQVDGEVRIELPNTDAYRILMTKAHLDQFVSEHGDVRVRFDEQYKVYRVDAFAAGRQSACEAKQAYCLQYGCE